MASAEALLARAAAFADMAGGHQQRELAALRSSMQWKPWDRGVCGCLPKGCSDDDDLDNCMRGFYCWPCVAGDISKFLEEGWKTCCVGTALLYPAAICCLRGEMRTRLNIEGTCIGDFLCALSCPCCVLIQMDYERRMEKQREKEAKVAAAAGAPAAEAITR